MDLERYVHPDYYHKTICELKFSRPEAESENQETIPSSFSTSKLYIQLDCNTIHHVVNVVGNYQCSRFQTTEVQSRVYVKSEALDRDLVTVLLNWEVPETFHDRIVKDVVEHVNQVIPCLDYLELWPTLTDCLLQVDITFAKFYSPNLDAYRQWLSGVEYNVEEESDDDHDGMVPASESGIESLVVRKRKREEIEKEDKEEESSNCPICLEEFTVGSETGSLPCSHMFHHDCIIHWLRNSHYCPLCRFKMPTADS